MLAPTALLQPSSCSGPRVHSERAPPVRAPLVQPAAAAKSSKAGNDAGSPPGPPAAPKPRGRPRKSKPPPAVDVAAQQQQQEPVLFPGAERMDPDVIQTASREQRQQAEIAIQELESDKDMEQLVQEYYEEPDEAELDEEVRELLAQYNISPEQAGASRQAEGGGTAAGAAASSSSSSSSIISQGEGQQGQDQQGEGSSSSQASGTGGQQQGEEGGGDGDEEEVDPRQAAGRKGAILLELIAEATGGGANLDAKIAQFEDDIDAELLKLLEQRITAASKVPGEEGAAHIEPLADLYSVLKLVYQRSSSSPALRLLDDVLFILGDDMGAEAYSSRRLEAMGRMREAFMGGMSPGVDIFAAAAALADAGPLAAAELATESVAVVDFLAEATMLLSGAKQQQAELMEAITRAEQEVQFLQKRQPEALRTPKAQAQLQQVRLAQQAHSARASSLSQLEDVVLLARELELQIKQSGGRTAGRGY